MYGYGHFDLTPTEIAKVLELIDTQDEAGLDQLYAELSEKRLG